MAQDSCMFCGSTPCECGAAKKPSARSKLRPKKVTQRTPKTQPEAKVETSPQAPVRKSRRDAPASRPSSKRIDPFEEPIRTLHFFGMLSREAVKDNEIRLARKKPSGIYQSREGSSDGS